MKKILIILLLLMLPRPVKIAADDIAIELDKNSPYTDFPIMCKDMLPGAVYENSYRVHISHKKKVTVHFDIKIDKDIFGLADHLFITIKNENNEIIADKVKINEFKRVSIETEKEYLTYNITSYFDTNYDYSVLPENIQAYTEATFSWSVEEGDRQHLIPSTGIQGSMPFSSRTVSCFVALGILVALFVFLFRTGDFRYQVLKIIVLIVLGTLITANTTYALYLARYDIKNNFWSTSHFDFDIDVDKTPAIRVDGFSNFFEPGRSKIAQLNITNAGELDLYYRISFRKVSSGAADLMDAMNIYLYNEDPITLNDPSLIRQMDGREAYSSICYTDGNVLEPGEKRTLYLVFEMKKEAGNMYQNTFSEFDIVCEAVQAANNERKEF